MKTYLFIIGLSLVSCKSKTQAPPVKPPATNAPVAATTGATGLLVGGETGLFLYKINGTLEKTLITTPVSNPRWLPGYRSALFLEESEKFWTVKQVDLTSGKQKLIARLPRRFECNDEALALEPSSRHDFCVDVSGERATLNLLDRNENMVSYEISFEINLKTGSSKHHVVTWENDDSCKKPPYPDGETFAFPPFVANQETTPATQPQPYAVEGSDDDHRLIRLANRDAPGGVTNLGDFEPELTASSGRWVILGGNEESADYIHRQVVVADLQNGLLFPLGGKSWPQPLTQKEIRKLIDNKMSEDPRFGDFVGESEIMWLPGDVLYAEGKLYYPAEKRVVALPGELAP